MMITKKPAHQAGIYNSLYHYEAENGGFEPPEACTSIDFKSTAIDHSANSPFERVKLYHIM